jgi:hypothetical protein
VLCTKTDGCIHGEAHDPPCVVPTPETSRLAALRTIADLVAPSTDPQVWICPPGAGCPDAVCRLAESIRAVLRKVL